MRLVEAGPDLCIVCEGWLSPALAGEHVHDGADTGLVILIRDRGWDYLYRLAAAQLASPASPASPLRPYPILIDC